MLRVVYEASQDLDPGKTVEIRESRGLVTIRIREGTYADEYIPPLNGALADFVGECGWFQIWRGQIISAASPENPLTVEYEADPKVSLGSVELVEDCGIVRLRVSPITPAELLVLIVNPAVERFLAGGQWFQLWEGEIVTMDSPDRVTV